MLNYKVFYISGVLLLICACRKNYNCVCSTEIQIDYNNTSIESIQIDEQADFGTTNHYIYSSSRKKAEEICQAFPDDNITTNDSNIFFLLQRCYLE